MFSWQTDGRAGDAFQSGDLCHRIAAAVCKVTGEEEERQRSRPEVSRARHRAEAVRESDTDLIL